jgi:glutamate dehydrogenase (NAD(P)+)
MAQEGMTIVAVSDNSAAVYNPKGLNVDGALAWVKEHRYLKGYPGGEAIPKEDLLTLDVDVLVPAAVENVITQHNAARIKAKIICEGANGPTTAGADSILEGKGIFVIPDILANAGGVTVSYFEWVQDRGGYFWDEPTVNERLDRILKNSFQDVLSLSQRHQVNLRTSAYMLAIERVAAVHRLRGMYA